MQIEVLKSKIHRVKVTGADLDYIGSITIDEDLMDAANIMQGEKVSNLIPLSQQVVLNYITFSSLLLIAQCKWQVLLLKGVQA